MNLNILNSMCDFLAKISLSELSIMEPKSFDHCDFRGLLYQTDFGLKWELCGGNLVPGHALQGNNFGGLQRFYEKCMYAYLQSLSRLDPMIIQCIQNLARPEAVEMDDYQVSCLLMVFVAVSIPRLARSDSSIYKVSSHLLRNATTLQSIWQSTISMINACSFSGPPGGPCQQHSLPGASRQSSFWCLIFTLTSARCGGQVLSDHICSHYCRWTLVLFSLLCPLANFWRPFWV